MSRTANMEGTRNIVSFLEKCGQGHLFPSDAKAADKERLAAQLQQLDKAFPGGLRDYCERARQLLTESREGKNPFAEYTPEFPAGVVLETASNDFYRMEQLGIQHGHQLAFCLVAGGLGERLGYPGIKVGLPIETVKGMTYLEFYLRMIRSVADAAPAQPTGGCCPLAIMTSGDTHDKTVALLETNNYFGFPKEMVTLLQQQKVPALSDSDARIATDPNDPYTVITKPHGHGDVHVLLHQHGLPQKWLSEGRTHVLIFQDTNGLVSHAVFPMLGVSIENDFVMNSLCIARKPKDAVGAVCRLQPKPGSSAKSLTINVEYNYLEAMLSDSKLKGDVADPKTGNSPFPGNANVLMLQLKTYDAVLQRSKGIVPEFVNPKYKDASRTTFKSPTRLECLMQDLPRLFEEDERAGFTMLDRWLAFSTVKNNATDAAAKCAAGSNPEAPFSAEADQSNCNAKLLSFAAQAVGCQDVSIAPPKRCEYLGITYDMGPTIFIDPSFGICLTQLKSRMEKCRKLHIAQDSVLELRNKDTQLLSLELDGFLFVDGGVVDEAVKNAGYSRQPLTMGDDTVDVPVPLKIRGYRYQKN